MPFSLSLHVNNIYGGFYDSGVRTSKVHDNTGCLQGKPAIHTTSMKNDSRRLPQ